MVSGALSSGTASVSSTFTLTAGLYFGFILFIPTYPSSGTTNFTNLNFSVSGTNVSVKFYCSDGLIPRSTMVYGIGSSYPFVNLGPILFSVSALSSDIKFNLTPTFTYGTNPPNIDSSSVCTYIRIA